MQLSRQYDSVSMLLSTAKDPGVDPSWVPGDGTYIYPCIKLLCSDEMYDSPTMPVRSLGFCFQESPEDGL